MSQTCAARTKTRRQHAKCDDGGSRRARRSRALRRRSFHIRESSEVRIGLNAYQKTSILVSGALLPLLLLFMKAMGYGYVWIVFLAAIACAALLVYALRSARD